MEILENIFFILLFLFNLITFINFFYYLAKYPTTQLKPYEGEFSAKHLMLIPVIPGILFAYICFGILFFLLIFSYWFGNKENSKIVALVNHPWFKKKSKK